MTIQKNIDVYLNQKKNIRIIDLVQYDTGIELVFNVVDYELPSSAIASLYVQKPSGKFVYQDAERKEYNVFSVKLNNQATAEYGRVPYQLCITGSNGIITTFAGVMLIEKSLKDAGATESKSVISAFNELTAEQLHIFMTEAMVIADQVKATIPDDYTETTEKVDTLFNSTANAIKGNLSGSVVAADDVSPLGCYLSVRAHGKNLLPYPYKETTKTASGITFTDNGDGTITANGTATATTTFNLNNNVPLIGGKTYVMSNNYMVASYKNEVGSVKWFIGTTPFVWNEEYTLVQLYLQISSGATVNNVVIKPQVEQGNTPTVYESWFDPSTVTVKRLGKNLLKNEENSQTINGITFAVQDDGTVSASGTATADATFVIYKRPPLEVGETYVLNGNPSGASENKYYMRLVLAWDGVNHNLYDYGTGTGFEVGGKVTAANLSITIKSGVTANGLLFKPMICHVSCDNSFEPYTEQTAIPAADGTVSGMTSLSPNMTILTDTEGVTIECEYIRDSNKVIERLVNAITALGGTV